MDADFQGYVVVAYGKVFHVEQWNINDTRQQDNSPLSSVWADAKLAQMVADIANVLDTPTLTKFIEVMEHR